jgi:hypothetical protein
MNYTNEQYLRLIAAIEAEGGELLDELCSSRGYEFSGNLGKDVILPGCGNTSIFEIPYEVPAQGTANASVLQPIRLCAVCDELGRTPRFKV